MATDRKRGKKKGFFSRLSERRRAVRTLSNFKEVNKELKRLNKEVNVIRVNLRDHELSSRQTADLLARKIKKKRPAKLDRLEEDVASLAEDVGLAYDLKKALDKLNSDFNKFKGASDEEFEDIINELKKSDVTKLESKLNSVANQVKDLSNYHDEIVKRVNVNDKDIDSLSELAETSKVKSIKRLIKDVDDLKVQLNDVSSLHDEVSKRLDDVDSDVGSLSKEFNNHQNTMDRLEQGVKNKLDDVNKQLKKKLPPPPLAPALESRMEKLEDDMSEMMDVAESAKEVSDSSREFMAEVDDQLTAVTKMLEEHKTTRIQAEANIVSKVDDLSKRVGALQRDFVSVTSTIGSVNSRLDGVMDIGSQLNANQAQIDQITKKIDRLEKRGFGALIID